MLGQPVQWSHVGILATTHSRYAIRGGSGLIYLLAFLMVGLSIAGLMIDPLKSQLKEGRLQAKQRNVNAEISDEQFVKSVASFVRPVVAWWVGADESKGKKDPFVEHLIVDKPPILSAYFLILMAFVPFTSCLAGFNQLSGDIGTKGLRYLLLRTERINIIVARFLGTIVFTAVTSLIVVGIVVLYIAISFDNSTPASLIGWGAQCWLTMLVFSLPYLCLCTWLSSAMDSPIATLVLCLMATGFPIVFIKIARATARLDSDWDWLDKLTPWGWKYDLLHPHFSKMISAYGVMFGVSAVLGFLAVNHFLRRDL